jgi:hypothetical protein
MKLSDLDAKNAKPDVLLLQTPSVKMMQFLQDRLKRKYHVTADAMITIETKNDFKRLKDVEGVVPLDSDRWFVLIDLDKFWDKDVKASIRNGVTCVFFCTCSKYKTYKTFKDEFKSDNIEIFDYYINYLRKTDFIYLYDAFVHKDNKLSNDLFNRVAKSYSGDIEAVFELLIHLSNGDKFKTMKDISDVCGFGGQTIETYIFSLFKPLSGSDKGLKLMIKKRAQVGADLGRSLKFSTMYNYMNKSIRTLCELKMLVISGVVYKRVSNLPNSFDEKALARYQKYLWQLRSIPMSELLLLSQCMGNVQWKTEVDFLNFLYKYYKIKSVNKLKEVAKNVDNLPS